MLTRLLLAPLLLAFCLGHADAAEADFKASAAPVAASAGDEVVVTVQRGTAGADCGLELRFGDGRVHSMRMEAQQTSVQITHRYQQSGPYRVEVAGKTQVRGLRTAFACPGKDQLLQIAARDGAQPVPAVASRSANASTPSAGAASGAGRRVALVIGNNRYQTLRPLGNPGNDAELVAKVLREQLQFDVVTVRDVDRRSMLRHLEDFGARATQADAAVFYFAGHGVSDTQNRNHLLPVEAELRTEATMAAESMSVDLVRDLMAKAAPRVAMILLDACRDLPVYAATRSGARGLVRVEATGGTQILIQMATAEGATAADGTGGNSPFAMALAQQLPLAGKKPILALAEGVQDETRRLTANAQSPAHFGNMRVSSYLVPAGTSAAAVGTGAQPPPAPDELRWRAIQASSQRADFANFVREFPASTYAPLADARLRQFDREAELDQRDRDLKAWTDADQTGTEAAYNAYLRAFPQGSYARMAQDKIRTLRTAAATPRPSPSTPPNTSPAGNTPPAGGSTTPNPLGAILQGILAGAGGKGTGSGSSPGTGEYDLTCAPGLAPVAQISAPTNFAHWNCVGGYNSTQPGGSCPAPGSWSKPNLWRIRGTQTRMVGPCP
jgi:hypothetical protein